MTLHSGEFECRAQYRGKNDTYTADITVRPKLSYIPPPHINVTKVSFNYQINLIRNLLALFLILDEFFSLLES